MKKKRLLLATLMTAICALFGVAAVACGTDNTDATYSVTFNVQGHGTAPAAITDIASGSKITKPEDPTDDDYDFGGWYKDAACEYVWNFDVDVVNSTRVLYALWTEKTYTVTFDAQGHGTAPAAATGVKKGAKVQEPDALTENGYAFLGWYKEAEGKTAWIFATDTVSGDVTLYALWKPVQFVSANHEDKVFTVNADTVCFKAPATGTYTVVSRYLAEKGLKSEAYTFGTNDGTFTLTVNTQDKTLKYERYGFNENFDLVNVELYNGAYTETDGTYSFEYTENEATATVTFTVNDNDSLKVIDSSVKSWSGTILQNTATYNTKYLLDNGEEYVGTQTYYFEKDSVHTIVTTRNFEITVTFAYYELPFDTVAEYVGTQNKTFAITNLNYQGGGTVKYDVTSANYGGDPVRAIAFDETSGIYTVEIGEETYGMKVTAQGVELYEADGEGWNTTTPYDVLAKVANVEEVKQNATISASGSQNTQTLPKDYGYAVFDVSSLIGQWIEIDYTGELTFAWLSYNEYSGVKGTISEGLSFTKGESFKLTNEYNFIYLAVTPAAGETSVTFTIKEGTVPQGLSAESPLTMTENTYTVNDAWSGETYYLTYTAQAGEFKVTVSYDGNGFTGYLYYTINGVEYGFNADAGEWVNPAQSHKKPYIVLTFTEGQVLNIAVKAPDYSNNFTIEIVEYTGEEEAGELTAGTFTFVDAGVGTYTLVVTGDKDSGFTASYTDGEQGFTVNDLTVTINDDGTYSISFLDPTGWAYNLTITAKADGSLSINGYNSMDMDATFTKDGGGSVTTPADLVSGTYIGSNGESTFTLVIDAEAMTVDYSDSDGELVSGATLSYNEATQEYSFQYEFYPDWPSTVTFTVSEDNTGRIVLSVNDDGIEYDAPSVVK